MPVVAEDDIKNLLGGRWAGQQDIDEYMFVEGRWAQPEAILLYTGGKPA